MKLFDQNAVLLNSMEFNPYSETKEKVDSLACIICIELNDILESIRIESFAAIELDPWLMRQYSILKLKGIL